MNQGLLTGHFLPGLNDIAGFCLYDWCWLAKASAKKRDFAVVVVPPVPFDCTI